MVGVLVEDAFGQALRDGFSPGARVVCPDHPEVMDTTSAAITLKGGAMASGQTGIGVRWVKA
ncbi:MAG: hypothetical protein ABIZ34_10205 [Candidatus Limnocylindrales bacterium]